MTGAQLILGERQRQASEEGWTFEHDDRHKNHELVRAAICYLETESTRKLAGPHYSHPEVVPHKWPWDDKYWKPTPDDRVKELVKAGALIAAEIDRLQRKKSHPDQDKTL